MARLEQGENFNEAPIVGGDGQPITQTEAPNQSGRTPPKLGPKQMAIAGVILIVLIVVVIIFFGSKGKEEQPPTDQVVSGDTATPNTSVPEEISDPFGDELDDPFGDMPDEVETTTQQGQLIVDPISNPYAYSFYTDEQVKSLRGYGYTGDEIEYNAQQQTPYDTLVDKAYEAYEEKYNEWMQTILDESSQGYKDLMAKTYLGNPKTKDYVIPEDVYTTQNYLENVDYEKCGVYNYQAWIKVHLSIGDIIINLPLTRYSQIADEGNILITFTTAVDKDGNILYLTKCEEYQV